MERLHVSESQSAQLSPEQRHPESVERARVSDRHGHEHGAQHGRVRAGQVDHPSADGVLRHQVQLRVDRLAGTAPRGVAADADARSQLPGAARVHLMA